MKIISPNVMIFYPNEFVQVRSWITSINFFEEVKLNHLYYNIKAI